MTKPQLDVGALYAALDSTRKGRKMSWRQVASAAGVSPSTLTRLGQGRRPDVDGFAALVRWLGASSEDFLTERVDQECIEPDLVTVISAQLRARKELTPETAKALTDIFAAAYRSLKSDEEE